MIILGLGSNLGDSIAQLRTAYRHINNIPGLHIQQVSPIYVSDALLPDNAPTEWDIPYLNLALRCETTLAPDYLLTELQQIETRLGRAHAKELWGPRVIDIDILAWDDVVIKTDTLTIPHAGLCERPFALWPLADVAPNWRDPHTGKTAAELVEHWGSRFTGKAPFHTRQLYQRIDAPQLVGILNVTPDSFSDGGKFLAAEKAFEQMMHLVYAGAEIIDIGAESTAPHAEPLSADEEWMRLEPILAVVMNALPDCVIKPKISIDTRHAATAKFALALGVDWINDVSGLDDPAMRELIAASTADCVVMHHLSIPERRDHVLPRNIDPVKTVYEWGARRLDELEKSGIKRERVIFDPGIGFGKMAEQSFALLKNIHAFSALGARLLVGHSRKSFLSLLTGAPSAERDIETLAISLYLAKQPVDYLRVHHVEMMARGLRVMSALK